MPDAVVRVIDVYPYRLRGEAVALLLMHRAEGAGFAGQWRMVGGKIRPGEAAWQATRRELCKETGRAPVCFWALPSLNVFYEWQHERVNLAPAFAAELGADPVLDREHDAFAWPQPPAARPEQRRLLRLAARLLREGVPPELMITG